MTPFDPRLPVIAAAARVKTCHVHHCFHAWRQMGQHFNARQFAEFAGLEEKHVSAILSALESHGATPRWKTASSKGTRLPAEFRAPEEWIDWAVAERQWTPEDARAEAANFADFWAAKPGADACKLDWRATWRNWVRNSRRENGTYRPQIGPTLSEEEYLVKTIAFYERVGRFTEAAELRRRLDNSSNVVPFKQEINKQAM